MPAPEVGARDLGAHQLNGLGRSPAVSAEVQTQTLTAIFDRLDEVAATGQVGIVELDLDLTTLLPRERIIDALKAAGEASHIAELKEPESLPYLPGYTEGAWDGFIQNTGLLAKYPQLSRSAGNTYGMFRGRYWSGNLAHDEVNPGLLSFIEQVRARGGEVVFVSGRETSHKAASIAALEAGGITDIKLLIGQLGGGDAGTKAARQAEIRADLGVPVAVIDDRETNRAAVVAAAQVPVLSVAIAAPGFSWTPDAAKGPYRIASFELL